MIETEFLVLGAGIAGVSVAAELARDRRVIVLEREAQPGYHATGRSAALFMTSYGNDIVRALTRASRDFLFRPPAGFDAVELVRRRGVLHVATASQEEALDRLRRNPDLEASTELLDAAGLLAKVPILSGAAQGGLFEAEASDLNVHALHQAYLGALRARGGALRTDAPTHSIQRRGDRWIVETRENRFAAPVLINAAGAWADEVARQAGVAEIGLTPMRRTAVLIDPPAGASIDGWPLVIDVEESFYFKPDAGMLLLSPADETPSAPCDAQADEMDVAVAVDRFETATTHKVRRVSHRWAGLRSFAPDRTPVVGFAPGATGFFWLAGQGGYGIQTAAAMSRTAAALARGAGVPSDILDQGVAAASLSPARLRIPLAATG